MQMIPARSRSRRQVLGTMLGGAAAAGLATLEDSLLAGHAYAAGAEPAYGWTTIPGIGKVRSLDVAYQKKYRGEKKVIMTGDRTITQAQRWEQGQKLNSAGAPLWSYAYYAGGPVVDAIHPTVITSCVVDLLNNYLKSNDRHWLERASSILLFLRGDATVVATAAGPARFATYRYHPDGDRSLPAVWYSSFGNSRMVGQCSRMYDITHEPIWRTIADEFLRAWTVPRSGAHPERPWFVDTLSSFAYYEKDPWSIQYTKDPVRAYNGMSSGGYGMAMYEEFIGPTPLTRSLLGAYFASIRHSWGSMRVKGDCSHYGLGSDGTNATYHAVNISSMSSMWVLTGDLFYLEGMHRLASDYPANAIQSASGERHQILVRPGVHEIRQGVPGGTPGPVTSWRAPSDLVLPVNQIHAWPGSDRSWWLKMGSGPRAVWWVRERPDAVALGAPARGASLQADALDHIRPGWTDLSGRPASITVHPGQRVSAYRYDNLGRTISTRSNVWARGGNALADAMAHINGRKHLRASNGCFAGMWLPAEDPIVSWTGITTRASARLRDGSHAMSDGTAWIGGRQMLHLVDGPSAGRWIPADGTSFVV